MTILDEIYSLKTQCDDASKSPEELAIIRAERNGQIKGLEKAMEIVSEAQ